MNCERCGQEVCEHPMLWVGSNSMFPDTTHVKCAGCGHNFGPVRELIEAKEKVATLTRERDEARGWAEQRLDHIHLCQMAKTTLTCERDEAVKERDEARQQWREAVDCLDTWKGIADAARARIAELEGGQDTVYGSKLNAALGIDQGDFEHALYCVRELRYALKSERQEVDKLKARIAESEHNLLSLNEYYLNRIAELEKAELALQSVKGGDLMLVHANGTWEWRKG